MKKVIISAFFATSLMAANNADYFSISAGNAEISVKASAGGVTANGQGDDTHYTATVGHYYGDTARVYASFSYVDPSGTVDIANALSFGYDFILPATNQFSLFAGPTAGYTWYKESSGSISVDISGFHYGAQAGAIAKISNSIELEAGYRYLIETGSDTVLGVKVDADNLKMWYVGANLRF